MAPIFHQFISVQQTSSSTSARKAGFKDKVRSHFFQELMLAVMLLILSAPYILFIRENQWLVDWLIDVCTALFLIEISLTAFKV